MKDAPKSGWPIEVDDDKIKALLEPTDIIGHGRLLRS